MDLLRKRRGKGKDNEGSIPELRVEDNTVSDYKGGEILVEEISAAQIFIVETDSGSISVPNNVFFLVSKNNEWVPNSLLNISIKDLQPKMTIHLEGRVGTIIKVYPEAIAEPTVSLNSVIAFWTLELSSLDESSSKTPLYQATIDYLEELVQRRLGQP